MSSIGFVIAALTLAQFAPESPPVSPGQPAWLQYQPPWVAPGDLTATSVDAQPSSALGPSSSTEYDPVINASHERIPAAWGVSAAWLSARGSAGLGVFDLGLSRTWYWSRELRPIIVTPGIGVHWFDERGLDLPAAVYDAYIDVSWRVVDRERGGISLEVAPGLYSDFQQIDSESFQVTGCVLGDYQITSRWTLVGGIAVVRQLHSHWLPVGGIIWIPNEDWQFDLTVPRPRIARRVYQTQDFDVWAYLAGQFGGGSWAVYDGVDDNVLLGYSDLRLLAGLNLWRGSGRELSCEFGYVFSRDVAVSEWSIFSPSDTWLVQATWVY